LKLAISNIAWELSEEDEILGILESLEIHGLEVAPTKIWKDPLKTSDAQIDSYRLRVNSKTVRIVSAQALLFGRPDLAIFKSEKLRGQTITYLEKIIKLVSKLGGYALVFGSPNNRARSGVQMDDALDIAVDFFRTLGEIAAEHNSCLCIEANPTDYNCDFITNTTEALELVKMVNHPGFGLHIDTSAMILNHEDPDIILPQCLEWMRHFHISEPFLDQVGYGDQDHFHARIAELLRPSSYDGWVSIEMRAGLAKSNIEAVQTALNFVLGVYG
jgi:sugar phosphate isomerase/epimerase